MSDPKRIDKSSEVTGARPLPPLPKGKAKVKAGKAEKTDALPESTVKAENVAKGAMSYAATPLPTPPIRQKVTSQTSGAKKGPPPKPFTIKGALATPPLPPIPKAALDRSKNYLEPNEFGEDMQYSIEAELYGKVRTFDEAFFKKYDVKQKTMNLEKQGRLVEFILERGKSGRFNEVACLVWLVSNNKIPLVNREAFEKAYKEAMVLGVDYEIAFNKHAKTNAYLKQDKFFELKLQSLGDYQPEFLTLLRKDQLQYIQAHVDQGYLTVKGRTKLLELLS